MNSLNGDFLVIQNDLVVLLLDFITETLQSSCLEFSDHKACVKRPSGCENTVVQGSFFGFTITLITKLRVFETCNSFQVTWFGLICITQMHATKVLKNNGAFCGKYEAYLP